MQASPSTRKRVLATIGCTNGQGFHFSEPLPSGAALDYWRSRSA